MRIISRTKSRDKVYLITKNRTANAAETGIIHAPSNSFLVGEAAPSTAPKVKTPFFAFPENVRRIMYTTNAIEALNSKLRRAIRARGHFPNDDAATKLLYLVLNRAAEDWRRPPREWCEAKTQFAVMFGERFVNG